MQTLASRMAWNAAFWFYQICFSALWLFYLFAIPSSIDSLVLGPIDVTSSKSAPSLFSWLDTGAVLCVAISTILAISGRAFAFRLASIIVHGVFWFWDSWDSPRGGEKMIMSAVFYAMEVFVVMSRYPRAMNQSFSSRP